MHAVFAPVTAADCVLHLDRSTEVLVGTSSTFELRIHDAEKFDRQFTGAEDVVALQVVSGKPRQTCYAAAPESSAGIADWLELRHEDGNSGHSHPCALKISGELCTSHNSCCSS